MPSPRCNVAGCRHTALPGTNSCAWHSQDEDDAPKAKPKPPGRSLTAAERRANGLELLQGLWLPVDLVRRLDACGKTRTAVVREALERWLKRAART